MYKVQTIDKLAILIPCYNEEKTIRKVVEDFKRIYKDAKIYVYDNNSTDQTIKEAQKAGAIVRQEFKQGKGNVLRRMFREIDAECYLVVDGDDTYPAEDSVEMVEKVLKKHCDMVVGDRLSSTYFTENKRRFHNSGNAGVRKAIQMLFNCNIKDVMTGYRALSYSFVKSFPVQSHGFEIETEMTIHAYDKNMYVDHVIIDYRDRPEGSVSKLNTISDGIKVLFTILNLYRCYKPFNFFGILSLLSVIISSLFFVPVLYAYTLTGIVLKFPTLICCCFLYLFAVISFFSGLVLSNIQKENHHQFEYQLHIMDQFLKIQKSKE